MRKSKSNRKKTKALRGGVWPPLLFIGGIILAAYLFSSTLAKKSVLTDPGNYSVDNAADYGKKGSVQLGDVKLIENTPTPTPLPTPSGDVCNHDMSKKADPDKCFCTNAWMIRCEGNTCKEIKYEKSGGSPTYTCAEANSNRYCEIFGKEGDGWYCIGKPVIYLYPEKPTVINVTVKTEGEIFVSDPQIEIPLNGWTNVLAHPDGKLIYRDKTYRELFYESKTKDVKRPAEGIVISKKNLERDLLAFITRLGLTKNDEQQEFLDWWVPQLKMLPNDNIFVSILETTEKHRLDEVSISPKPDTFIEFIAYFAPLKDGESVTPLVLPPTPKRIGFTAIEWGGVIGK